MANDAPRSILHMNECPMCGYDLSRLPSRHQCPECGFAYDEDMCVIVADVSKANRHSNWLRRVWFVPFVLAGIGSLTWNRFPSPVVAWIVVIAAFIATSVARRVVRKRQGGDSKLWFQRDGVAVQNVLGK